jgi:hypothetical protein
MLHNTQHPGCFLISSMCGSASLPVAVLHTLIFIVCLAELGLGAAVGAHLNRM